MRTLESQQSTPRKGNLLHWNRIWLTNTRNLSCITAAINSTKTPQQSKNHPTFPKTTTSSIIQLTTSRQKGIPGDSLNNQCKNTRNTLTHLLDKNKTTRKLLAIKMSLTLIGNILRNTRRYWLMNNKWIEAMLEGPVMSAKRIQQTCHCLSTWLDSQWSQADLV